MPKEALYILYLKYICNLNDAELEDLRQDTHPVVLVDANEVANVLRLPLQAPDKQIRSKSGPISCLWVSVYRCFGP